MPLSLSKNPYKDNLKDIVESIRKYKEKEEHTPEEISEYVSSLSAKAIVLARVYSLKPEVVYLYVSAMELDIKYTWQKDRCRKYVLSVREKCIKLKSIAKGQRKEIMKRIKEAEDRGRLV